MLKYRNNGFDPDYGFNDILPSQLVTPKGLYTSIISWLRQVC